MPVDIKYLRSQGLSAGDYKKIFTADPAKYPTRVRRLVDLIRDRTDDGYRMCLNNWKGYAAIDIACEASFQQNTPTLVRHVLSRNLSAADTLEQCKMWGLNEGELFQKQTLEGGQTVDILNPPVFYKILVPLVMAYLTAREARLFNDRVGDFLKFKPLKETSVQRIFCDVWSGILSDMGRDLSYAATFRQAIHQTLKHGVMLAFPKEQWYCETQVYDDGQGPREKTIKEGIRYELPHVSKFFYDTNHALSYINTDSGPEFTAHWDVKRFGDILDNRKYWNRNKIVCGNNWMKFPGAGSYFSEFFPCTLQFPLPEFTGHDRTNKNAWYNNRTSRDKAIFLTQFFMKIIPRDWGLGRYEKGKLTGTYNYPVWHRFTMAGYDTVIFAEPYAYNPTWFMGYDYDFNAARNDSLALQLIPWQDHLGNILTNMLYQAYRNLTNLTFYNNQVVDPGNIEKLQQSGFKQFAGLNFVGFNPLKWAVGRNDADKVFHNVQFQQQTIQEMLSMANLLLSIMERVQQFSAQETGAAASHQQSVVEVQATGGATSQRLRFTGGFIDEGVDAWKLQLVHGSKAYKDPGFTVSVSATIPDVLRHLAELGFTVVSQGDEKIEISGHKKFLRLEQFASSNETVDPDQSEKVAHAIFQAVTMIAQQPDLHQKVGAKNILKMIEAATIIGGGPSDFRIPYDDAAQGGDLPPSVIQAIQTAQKATIQQIEQQQLAPAAQHIQQVEQQVQAMQATLEQLKQIYKVADAAQQKVAIEQQRAQSKEQIDQAKFAAEERRKQEAHQAELQRAQEEAAAKIQIEAGKAQAKVQTDHHAAVLEASMPQPAAPEPIAQPTKISESIDYKSAPEEVKRQMESQAGIIPPANPTYLQKKEKAPAPAKPAKKK